MTKKALFDRITKEVMDIADDDLLMKALDSAGLDAVSDLLTLSDEQIDSLAYDDGTGPKVPSLGSRNKLRILRSWNAHLQQVQGVRRVDWWDEGTVSKDEYDEYRVGIYAPPGMPMNLASPVSVVANHPSAPVQPTPRPAPVSNPASDFRRGIKRDKSHYKEIVDEKQWDEFKRTTIATVYAHGCENVISPSYTPSSPNEIVLFDEQRHYVRLHENTRDAQAVWRGYVSYMRSSTRADIEIKHLMTSLTSLVLPLLQSVPPNSLCWIGSTNCASMRI